MFNIRSAETIIVSSDVKLRMRKLSVSVGLGAYVNARPAMFARRAACFGSPAIEVTTAKEQQRLRIFERLETNR